jgi:hypothetical protein
MSLQFPGSWRFATDTDKLPDEARWAFDDLIGRIALQGSRWTLIEHFKGYFVRAIGASHVWSSSEDWADTDLRSYMEHAASNAPIFIEAFYNACEDLKAQGLDVPDVDLINRILNEKGVPFEIRPPNLIKVAQRRQAVVAPAIPPPSLAENAAAVFEESSRRCETLLAEGRPREAVQEMLWMLESLATVFRGTTVGATEVRGRYFNEIARELRAGSPGTTFERVMEWCVQLHGFLSSPTGGGVRHGLDLRSGTPISQAEGRLFCNLVLSYVGFILSEHERLNRAAG